MLEKRCYPLVFVKAGIITFPSWALKMNIFQANTNNMFENISSKEIHAWILEEVKHMKI